MVPALASWARALSESTQIAKHMHSAMVLIIFDSPLVIGLARGMRICARTCLPRYSGSRQTILQVHYSHDHRANGARCCHCAGRRLSGVRQDGQERRAFALQADQFPPSGGVATPAAKKKTAPSPVPFIPAGRARCDFVLLSCSCCYFFVSAGLPSPCLAGSAAGAAPACALNGVVWPFFTIAIGVTLPFSILKIVISASLRSPLESNCTWPVAPLKETLKSSGANLAGSVESAFFIASITALVAS